MGRVVEASMAHRILRQLYLHSVAVPTTMVATVFLTLSCRGISLSDLVEHVHWLQGEIISR